MKNSTLNNIVLVSSLITLTACGGGGSDTPPPTDTGVSLATAFHETIKVQSTDMQGAISTACYANNSNGIIETVAISDTTWTYTVNTHTGDISCTNTPISTTAVATINFSDTQEVQNWINENGGTNLTAPASAGSSSVNLPQNSAYTVINGEVSSSNNPDIATGVTFSTGYIIDDSADSGVVLYRVRDTTNNVATVDDPFTNVVEPVITTPTVSGSEIQITIDEVKNTSTNNSTIQYTLKNIGDTDTGNFYVVGWHDRATAPDYNSASSAKLKIHSNLSAGASEVHYISVNNTNVTPGTSFNAYVIADFGQSVAEVDEGLTGTNDNLSHKAWTVNNVFSHNGITSINDGTDPLIKMEYHTGNDQTVINMNRDYISNQGNFNKRYYLRLRGTIPTANTTSTGAFEMDAFFYLNGIYYAVTPDDTTSKIDIYSAGQVGDNVSGYYNVNLCPTTDIVSTGCGVNKINHSGTFQIVRGADI